MPFALFLNLFLWHGHRRNHRHCLTGLGGHVDTFLTLNFDWNGNTFLDRNLQSKTLLAPTYHDQQPHLVANLLLMVLPILFNVHNPALDVL